MKAFVVLAALAVAATAAPNYDQFENQDIFKRERKSPTLGHGSSLGHGVQVVPVPVITHDHSHGYGHHQIGHHGLGLHHGHIYREDEGAAMMKPTESPEMGMENSIKLAKAAIDNMQQTLSEMEDSTISEPKWQHGKTEADIHLHENIQTAKAALQNVQTSFNDLQAQSHQPMDTTKMRSLDIETSPDVAIDDFEKMSEKQKMAQWKEAIKNIERNVEIADNIKKSFRSMKDSEKPEVSQVKIEDMKRDEELKSSPKTSTVIANNQEIVESQAKMAIMKENAEKPENKDSLPKMNKHNMKLKHDEMEVAASTVNEHKSQAKMNGKELKTESKLLHHDETNQKEEMIGDNPIKAKNTETVEPEKKTKMIEHQNVAPILVLSKASEDNGSELKMHLEKDSTLTHDHSNELLRENTTPEHVKPHLESKMDMKESQNLMKFNENNNHMRQQKNDDLLEKSVVETDSLKMTDLNKNLDHKTKLMDKKKEDAEVSETRNSEHIVMKHENLNEDKPAEHISLMKASEHTHNHQENVVAIPKESMAPELSEKHPKAKFPEMTKNAMSEMKTPSAKASMNEEFHNKMRDASEANLLENMMKHRQHEHSRNAYGAISAPLSAGYGAGASAGGSGGAIGVFPHANAGGCAVPLLLSCSPSVVHGTLAHPAKSHGSYGSSSSYGAAAAVAAPVAPASYGVPHAPAAPASYGAPSDSLYRSDQFTFHNKRDTRFDGTATKPRRALHPNGLLRGKDISKNYDRL